MEVTSYTVTVERDQDAWTVHVAEIDRVTQARTLSEVDEMARDLIDIMVGDTAPDLDVHIQVPEVAQAHLATVRQRSADEEQARTDAAKARRDAALALKAQGLSMRDIGAVLGVSHQRASQLTKPALPVSL